MSDTAVVNYALEPGSVELRDIDQASIEPDQVLLEVANIGVDGSTVKQERQSNTNARLGELDIREVKDRIIASGWVDTQLQECLDEYESLGVFQITDDQKLIFL